jgi:hypothetical protein
VVESMTGALLVHDTLEQQGWSVEIADAQKVKCLAPLACKTDRIDSMVLATLSHRDLVPAIWLPDPRIREERELARFRMHLVKHKTALKCRIHSTLINFGRPCPVNDLFGAEGRELLRRLEVPEPWRSNITASLCERLAARAAEHDRDGSYPFEAIDALKAARYFAAPVPLELGGLGVSSAHDLVVASSRLARGDASVAIGVNMHLVAVLNMERRRQVAAAAGQARRARVFASSLEGVELSESGVRGGFRAGDPLPYMERNLVAGLFHAAASLGIAESADRRGIALNGSPLARAYRDVKAGSFMHPLGANRAYDHLAHVALGEQPSLH